MWELQAANQKVPKVRRAYCRESRGDGGLPQVTIRIPPFHSMNEDHFRGDSRDDQEKNRVLMAISLASKTNAEINSGVNKSPVKTSGGSIGAARLDAFTTLTTAKKKRRERKGKSPKRAFAKEVGWQETQVKTDTGPVLQTLYYRELMLNNKN